MESGTGSVATNTADNSGRAKPESFCFIACEAPWDTFVAVHNAHGQCFHSIDIQVTIMDRKRASLDPLAP